MRRLRYEVYFIHDITNVKEGTIADLLFDIPYLLGWGNHFPSRDELNSLLRTGISDAGMSGGCEWEPFELSEDEYAEVVSAIKRDVRLSKRPHQ